MSQELVFNEKPRIKYHQSMDGLMNVFSGMGTGNSKSANNYWQNTGWMTGPMIDAIYRESWLAQRICSVPAEDATRQWRRFNGKSAEEIGRYEVDLELQSKVAEAKTFARAYGGAGILMITDQNLEKPLDVERIRKGSLKKLIVLDRWDLSAIRLNLTNPLEDNYLLPDHYTLVNGSQKIHYSHIARFEGLKLPRRLAQLEQGWGDSELRRVLQDINMVVASFMGIGELMQQANVDVINREGLFNDMTTDQDQEIIRRYNLFNLMKSNYGLSLLDGTEKLERLTLQLTGVSQSLEQLITWISGAAQIPVSRLFGTSAKGMNATGEGDEDIYNDRIKSIQTRELNAPIKHLDKVMVRSALGSYPDDCDFMWNPLSQLDDEEQANVDYTQSQTDRAYFDIGVIKKSHIAKRLQAKDVYEIDDDHIEEIEAQEKADKDFEEEDDFNLGEELNEPESDPSKQAA